MQVEEGQNIGMAYDGSVFMAFCKRTDYYSIIRQPLDRSVATAVQDLHLLKEHLERMTRQFRQQKKSDSSGRKT